jgi:hypothetical protein
MKEYEVKFLVQAVVVVNVNADNFNEAIEKAEKKKQKEGIFKDYLSYLDGHEELCGFDDMDKWSQVS